MFFSSAAAMQSTDRSTGNGVNQEADMDHRADIDPLDAAVRRNQGDAVPIDMRQPKSFGVGQPPLTIAAQTVPIAQN